MCEISSASIGTINDGVDVAAADKLANIARLTDNRCRHCWAIRFCSMCVCHCTDMESNSLSKEMKNAYCDREIHSNEEWLKKYVRTKDCEKV